LLLAWSGASYNTAAHGGDGDTPGSIFAGWGTILLVAGLSFLYGSWRGYRRLREAGSRNRDAKLW
jgi:hypothetical protein